MLCEDLLSNSEGSDIDVDEDDEQHTPDNGTLAAGVSMDGY